MLLYRGQEKQLKYAPKSPYNHSLHPELPKGEVTAPTPTPEIPEPAVKEKIEVKIPKVREIKEVELEEEVDKEDDLEEVEGEEQPPEPPAKEKKEPSKKKGAK
jgi:hypothetical protein